MSLWASGTITPWSTGYFRRSRRAAATASFPSRRVALAVNTGPVGLPRAVDAQNRTSGKFLNRLGFPALA